MAHGGDVSEGLPRARYHTLMLFDYVISLGKFTT